MEELDDQESVAGFGRLCGTDHDAGNRMRLRLLKRNRPDARDRRRLRPSERLSRGGEPRKSGWKRLGLIMGNRSLDREIAESLRQQWFEHETRNRSGRRTDQGSQPARVAAEEKTVRPTMRRFDEGFAGNGGVGVEWTNQTIEQARKRRRGKTRQRENAED
jgi:hypothetical protein